MSDRSHEAWADALCWVAFWIFLMICVRSCE